MANSFEFPLFDQPSEGSCRTGNPSLREKISLPGCFHVGQFWVCPVSGLKITKYINTIYRAYMHTYSLDLGQGHAGFIQCRLMIGKAPCMKPSHIRLMIPGSLVSWNHVMRSYH